MIHLFVGTLILNFFIFIAIFFYNRVDLKDFNLVINLIFIPLNIILYLNIKKNKKIYESLNKRIKNGDIQNVLCKFTFNHRGREYKSGEYYKIEYFNGNYLIYFNTLNFNGIQINRSETIILEDYVNKFDFNTLKEKRKKKLKKLNKNWFK